MQAIVPTSARNPNGHTAAEIRAALVGSSGTRRWSFRYELLDSTNVFVADLDNVLTGSVANNHLADIKRTAKFRIQDSGEIDYLSDRIKPYARLHLEPYGEDDWVEWPLGVFILSTPTRTAEEDGTVLRDVEGFDQLQALADDLIADRYTAGAPTEILEDFADTTYTIAWSSGGTAWARSTTAAHSGTHSLKAGAIGNSASSTVTFTIPAGATELVFWYKTSTEDGFDFLEGYVGAVAGTPTLEASGENDWTQATFNVTGATQVNFRYIKDGSATEGSDTVWIDDLRLFMGDVLYTDEIADLLTDFDVNLTESAATMPAAREWEPGTSKLKIVNDLLRDINYGSLYFDEEGVAQVAPYRSPADRAAEWTYADDDDSLIIPRVDQTLDLFTVPNKWVLVVSEPDRDALTGTYTNDDPGSPTSTVRRGRTITDFRQEQTAPDQATLDELAARLAFTASQVYEVLEFSTGINPLHSNNDVYAIEFGSLAINEKYAEHEWSMDLEAGAEMRHKARRVVTV